MGRWINQRIASLKQSLESRIPPQESKVHPHAACWVGKWEVTSPQPGTPGSSLSSSSCSSRSLNKAPKPPPETGEMCPCRDSHHIFFASTAPRLQTAELMRRLIKYMEFGDEDVLFAVAFLYMDRAAQRYRDRALFLQDGSSSNSTSLVTVFSAHRVFFTCCVLAAKFGLEKPFKNKFYADVGGIPNCAVMLQLELALLDLLQYELFPQQDAFKDMYQQCFEAAPPQSPASVKRAPPLGLESLVRRRDSASCSGSRRQSVVATVSPLPFMTESPPPPSFEIAASPTASCCGGLSNNEESPMPRIPSKCKIFGSCDDFVSFATAVPSEEAS